MRKEILIFFIINSLFLICNVKADIIVYQQCQNGLILTLQSTVSSYPCVQWTAAISPDIGQSGTFTGLNCRSYTLSGIGGVPEPEVMNGASIHITGDTACVCSDCPWGT